MKTSIKFEHDEQAALFRWAALNRKKHPELALMFAIPNGGHRHISVARRLKAEGVKAGVPDIFLPVKHQAYFTEGDVPNYHGLFIEMKAGKNTPTPAQVWWHEHLRDSGYCVEVCYGWEEAVKLIKQYLG